MLHAPQEKGIYDEGDIMKAKLALLQNTNMVDFAMDIHKSLYDGAAPPQSMKERRAEVVARLRRLQQEVDPIMKCLENPNVVRNFRQDKTFNLQARGGGGRAPWIRHAAARAPGPCAARMRPPAGHCGAGACAGHSRVRRRARSCAMRGRSRPRQPPAPLGAAPPARPAARLTAAARLTHPAVPARGLLHRAGAGGGAVPVRQVPV